MTQNLGRMSIKQTYKQIFQITLPALTLATQPSQVLR